MISWIPGEVDPTAIDNSNWNFQGIENSVLLANFQNVFFNLFSGLATCCVFLSLYAILFSYNSLSFKAGFEGGENAETEG
jgi:hypothetical protein